MNTSSSAYSGTSGPYFWIQSPDYSLDWLLQTCPGIVVAKYVAVTACDSGPMRLSDTELSSGWHMLGDIAYSPVVANARDIYSAGYDEWYIMPEPRSIDVREVFVNFGGFGLNNPWSQFARDLDPTWDRRIYEEWAESCAARNNRYWAQMREIGAESYVADGDNLLLVTMNREQHKCVQAAIEATGGLVRHDE